LITDAPLNFPNRKLTLFTALGNLNKFDKKQSAGVLRCDQVVAAIVEVVEEECSAKQTSADLDRESTVNTSVHKQDSATIGQDSTDKTGNSLARYNKYENCYSLRAFSYEGSLKFPLIIVWQGIAWHLCWH
jgi:hypothetical protein